MLPADAVRLVERLRRAYPRDVLEPESAEAYARQVAEFANRELAVEAMRDLIRSAERLPSIAEIRGAYQRRLRCLEDRHAMAELDARPRVPLPPEAQEFLDRMTRPLLQAQRQEELAELGVRLVPVEDGGCDDGCGSHGPRVTFGVSGRAVCHDCAESRLRALVKAGSAE